MSLVWFLPLLTAAALLLAEGRSRALLRQFDRNDGNFRRVVDDLLGLGALTLLLVSLGSPSSDQAADKGEVSVAFAIDVSRSMAARQDGTSRLDRVRAGLLELVDMLPAAEFALVPFAGEPVIQVPLTRDREGFEYFLRHLEVGQVSSAGSAPEEAALLAQQLLSTAAGRKMVILVTDGERTLPTEPPDLLPGIPVHVLGIGGAAPAAVPDRNGKPRLDAEGNPLLTRPDPARLEALAAGSGGEVFTETTDWPAPLVSHIRPAPDQNHDTRLLPAFALVLLLLRALPRPSRSSRILGPLLLLLLAGCHPVEDDDGRAQFESALSGNTRPATRAELFLEAARRLPKAEQAVALFNAGTLLLQAGSANRAVDTLEQALVLQPGDPDIRRNLVLALRLAQRQPPGGGGDPHPGVEPRPGRQGLPRSVAERLAESVSPAPFSREWSDSRPVQEIKLEKDW